MKQQIKTKITEVQSRKHWKNMKQFRDLYNDMSQIMHSKTSRRTDEREKKEKYIIK